MSFLFKLSKELGILLGVVSLLIAIVTYIYPSTSKKSKPKIIILAISITILILLSINYIIFQDYNVVPYVENLEYAQAQTVLYGAGYKVLISDNTAAYNGQSIIIRQLPESGKVLKKGSTIQLLTGVLDNFDDENDELTNDYEEGISANRENDLTIIVEHYEVQQNGRVAIAIPPFSRENLGYIDIGQNISGTFRYSRKLTEEEFVHWSHGGKILDMHYKEVTGDKINATFWADKSGNFSMEIPENLPNGNYIYFLYIILDGNFLSAEIPFKK